MKARKKFLLSTPYRVVGYMEAKDIEEAEVLLQEWREAVGRTRALEINRIQRKAKVSLLSKTPRFLLNSRYLRLQELDKIDSFKKLDILMADER